jgi:hypothetical protein
VAVVPVQVDVANEGPVDTNENFAARTEAMRLFVSAALLVQIEAVGTRPFVRTAIIRVDGRVLRRKVARQELSERPQIGLLYY